MVQLWTFFLKFQGRFLMVSSWNDKEFLNSISAKICLTFFLITCMTSFWHICSIIKDQKGAQDMLHKVVLSFIPVIWLDSTQTQAFTAAFTTVKVQYKKIKSDPPTLPYVQTFITPNKHFFFFALRANILIATIAAVSKWYQHQLYTDHQFTI